MIRHVFLDSTSRLRSGWRIGAMFALVALAMLLINTGWRALGLPGMREGGGWWFLLFAALVSGSIFGILLLLLRWLEGAGSRAIAMPFDASAWRMTGLGILLGAVPILLVMLSAIVGGYGALVPAELDLAGFAATTLPLLCAGFLLAAWEEIVLRGYLLRQFALGINAPAAVVITGTLFGLAHAGNPGANWQGLVYTALGGMLMGWLVLRSGSLWLLIGYHFGWNAVSSAVFGLELSGFDGATSVFSTTLDGPDWLTGGSYGFEASLPALFAELLTLGLALWLVGRPAAPPALLTPSRSTPL